MKHRGTVARLAFALVVACAALPATAASAATRPEGVTVVDACHRLSASAAPPSDDQYTLSVGDDLFEISESTQLSSTMGVSGVSWARWDMSGRYDSPTASSYLLLTCSGDLQFWHAPGARIWHTGTTGGAHVILNSQGEIRLYNSDWSRIVWRSRSGQRYLATGHVLSSGGWLASSGEMRTSWVNHILTMQRDGNLVYRVGGTIRWQSGTHVAGAHAALNTHAQLVVIGPHGHLLWSSHITGSRLSALDVQHLRIDDYHYADGARTIWQAHLS